MFVIDILPTFFRHQIIIMFTVSKSKVLMAIDDGHSVEIVNEFCCLGDMLSVDGDADAAVTARIHSNWFKFSSFGSSFSLLNIFPYCCEEKFMMHVYRVVCYMEVRCGH